MARLSPDQVAGLNVALNEATLIGLEIQPETRRAAITLSMLSLPPDDGPPPADPRISLQLQPVGRVSVSWRLAAWNDPAALPQPLTVDQLFGTVERFGHLPIYGRTFLDAGDAAFSWADRSSLDLDLESKRDHTLDLFQEGRDEFIELRIWFDELEILRPIDDRLVPVTVEEVAAAGRRWWDGLYARDPRTAAAGIFPLESS